MCRRPTARKIAHFRAEINDRCASGSTRSSAETLDHRAADGARRNTHILLVFMHELDAVGRARASAVADDIGANGGNNPSTPVRGVIRCGVTITTDPVLQRLRAASASPSWVQRGYTTESNHTHVLVAALRSSKQSEARELAASLWNMASVEASSGDLLPGVCRGPEPQETPVEEGPENFHFFGDDLDLRHTPKKSRSAKTPKLFGHSSLGYSQFRPNTRNSKMRLPS